jgi:Glycosyl transferase family 2
MPYILFKTSYVRLIVRLLSHKLKKGGSMKLWLSLMLSFFSFLLFPRYSFAPQKQPLLAIKIVTRGNPEHFFSALDSYATKLSGSILHHFIITCDRNDPSMYNQDVITRLQQYPHLSLFFVDNATQVEAYNSNLEQPFDVILIASDTVIPVSHGYDARIMSIMLSSFPDYDGILHFNNEHDQQAHIFALGKKYYDRFGYLYNPSYTHTYFQQELTLVAKILRKEKICNKPVLFFNRSGHILSQYSDWKKEDDKNDDAKLFLQRRSLQFDITQEQLKQSLPKRWSILICTLEERQHLFQQLHNKLVEQINNAHLQNDIEILFCRDNRQHSIGEKRNILLQTSQGEYVSFIDDDDDIHNDYVPMLYKALQENPDCIRLMGIITTNNKDPKIFIHSSSYNNQYIEKNEVYYRPPNHLNVMKRSIAIQFAFPEQNYGEDKIWALSIAQSKLIKTEADIKEPYYFYRYDGKYSNHASTEVHT